MTSKLGPYSAYNDSGLEWLREGPVTFQATCSLSMSSRVSRPASSSATSRVGRASCLISPTQLPHDKAACRLFGWHPCFV